LSALGHSRRFDNVRDESGLPPTPDVLRYRNNPMLIDAGDFEIFSREIESDFSRARNLKGGVGWPTGGPRRIVTRLLQSTTTTGVNPAASVAGYFNHHPQDYFK
jgi:hypothetical protein